MSRAGERLVTGPAGGGPSFASVGGASSSASRTSRTAFSVPSRASRSRMSAASVRSDSVCIKSFPCPLPSDEPVHACERAGYCGLRAPVNIAIAARGSAWRRRRVLNGQRPETGCVYSDRQIGATERNSRPSGHTNACTFASGGASPGRPGFHRVTNWSRSKQSRCCSSSVARVGVPQGRPTEPVERQAQPLAIRKPRKCAVALPDARRAATCLLM